MPIYDPITFITNGNSQTFCFYRYMYSMTGRAQIQLHELIQLIHHGLFNDNCVSQNLSQRMHLHYIGYFRSPIYLYNFQRHLIFSSWILFENNDSK